MNNPTKKLPAGEYYIGDPCYVIDNDKWSEFLEPFWEQKPSGGFFEVEGHLCAAFYTKYGDGGYTLNPGAYYLPVDAGMIGAIPAALCHTEGAGAYVTMDEPFECYADEDNEGKLCFGEYIVYTDDDEVDDDDRCPECGQ